ncbi:MAG: DUF2259 domain-containing protein [Treponema sp.]|nr:DUF2259 domain-containing protein [Treponema sp.]MCR4630210.1 DUF2259 domain-containing protein [Treponema sp.]
MKRIFACSIVSVFLFTALFAGDVASFVDKGFTEDGKYYLFGQFGKTDKKFQGWAEIYQVDIEKNDYVNGGVFRTKPSAVTAGKNGREVYEALEAKSFYYLKDVKCEKADPEHVLYILDDVNKSGTDEIVFTDFKSDIENPDTFHIQLVPTVNGSGKKVSSSFYIDVEKRDADGNLIFKKKVGSPDIVRKGVYNYKIERIVCDKSEKSFIFVVEKMMEDDSGINIRYMVEAARF